jgi:hypothetical protein
MMTEPNIRQLCNFREEHAIEREEKKEKKKEAAWRRWRCSCRGGKVKVVLESRTCFFTNEVCHVLFFLLCCCFATVATPANFFLFFSRCFFVCTFINIRQPMNLRFIYLIIQKLSNWHETTTNETRKEDREDENRFVVVAVAVAGAGAYCSVFSFFQTKRY